MKELEKCLASKPVTKEYALSLIKKGRSASSDVALSLIGMLFRGEKLELGEPLIVERQPKPCEICGGGGLLTNDQFRLTQDEVADQISKDRQFDPESKGRTEIALESGALSFEPCADCGGQGSTL